MRYISILVFIIICIILAQNYENIQKAYINNKARTIIAILLTTVLFSLLAFATFMNKSQLSFILIISTFVVIFILILFVLIKNKPANLNPIIFSLILLVLTLVLGTPVYFLIKAKLL